MDSVATSRLLSRLLERALGPFPTHTRLSLPLPTMRLYLALDIATVLSPPWWPPQLMGVREARPEYEPYLQGSDEVRWPAWKDAVRPSSRHANRALSLPPHRRMGRMARTAETARGVGGGARWSCWRCRAWDAMKASRRGAPVARLEVLVLALQALTSRHTNPLLRSSWRCTASTAR